MKIDIINEDETAKYRSHLVVSINVDNNQLNLEIGPREFPDRCIGSTEIWYPEHIKQFDATLDFF